MTETHFCLDDSPLFQMLELDEVTSTNDFLREYHPLSERRITLVTAEYQTAGRGAGQNHWESRRGENLTFSLLTHPRHIQPSDVFVLSEVLALAVQQALFSHLSPITSHPFKIKWPNDIYYDDRKICGMLIENDMRGATVENCIMGVGINVNQTRFESDAPNPVSLVQITGHVTERRFVLERVMERFTQYYNMTERGQFDEIHQHYLEVLYRRGERHRFRDKMGIFEGTIDTVEPTGHLIIVDEKGKNKRYAFKEVEYVINEN